MLAVYNCNGLQQVLESLVHDEYVHYPRQEHSDNQEKVNTEEAASGVPISPESKQEADDTHHTITKIVIHQVSGHRALDHNIRNHAINGQQASGCYSSSPNKFPSFHSSCSFLRPTITSEWGPFILQCLIKKAQLLRFVVGSLKNPQGTAPLIPFLSNLS